MALVTIKTGPDTELRVEVTEWQGRRIAQIRHWWTTHSGEKAPSKNGVTFGPELLGKLAQALEKLAPAPATQARKPAAKKKVVVKKAAAKKTSRRK